MGMCAEGGFRRFAPCVFESAARSASPAVATPRAPSVAKGRETSSAPTVVVTPPKHGSGRVGLPGSYRGRRIWRSDGISGDGFRHLLPRSHLLGLGRVGGRIVPFTVGTQRKMRVRPLVETPTETNRTSPWVPTWDCTGTNGGTHQGSHSEDEMKGMRGWRRWLNPSSPARGYEYREGRKRPRRERSTHTGARSARAKLWSPHQRHERRSVRW